MRDVVLYTLLSLDGVAEELPPLSPDGPPVQLERFSPVGRH